MENQPPQALLGVAAADLLLGLDLLEIVVAPELVGPADKAEGVEHHQPHRQHESQAKAQAEEVVDQFAFYNSC